jgi:hypothetical protein
MRLKKFSGIKIRRKSLPAVNEPNDLKSLKSIKKKWVWGLVLSFLGIAIICAALFWPAKKQTISADPPANVADQCTNSVTYSCYKKQLTDITNKQGPIAAISVIKSSYTKVPYVKSECHQLMHVIGRAALIKYNDDIAQTYSHGDQFCWSGYYHGAIEELGNVKGLAYLVANSNAICAKIPGKSTHSFYYYNCVHGMGHGFMFVENGNLFAALKDCDSLTDSWDSTSCYGGVFMQNVMNEQAPDEESDTAGTTQQSYLKADQPMYPCTAVDEKYKDQCYLMQTSYALQTVNYDFNKVFNICSQVESQFRDTCYTSLGRDASGNSISDANKTKSTCLEGPTEEAQKYCVHGAAMDFVSYFHSDVQAKQLCTSLPSNLSDDCLSTVKNYYSSF